MLAQMLAGWTLIIGVLLVVSTAGSLPRSTSGMSLFHVAQWIDQTGKSTVIRGLVAEALGFPDVDIPVLERGFRDAGEKHIHVGSTTGLLGFEDIIFLESVDEGIGDALIWRATRNGELVSTARFARGVARRIPNIEAQTAFVAEKDYLLEAMQAQTFRASTAPASGPQPSSHPSEEAGADTLPEPWRHTALPSAAVGVLLNPWLLPVIAIILAVAAQSIARKR